MPKNESYTTLTKGQTFYFLKGENEGTKVKVTRVRANKYCSYVEYEGHNGVRRISGEVGFAEGIEREDLITRVPTDAQRVAFAKALAKRVAEYAEEMEEAQKQIAHAKAFREAHQAEVDAPLVWSEPVRKVGYEGRSVTYTSTAKQNVFRGTGFDIRVETERREVEVQLILTQNAEYRTTGTGLPRYVEVVRWEVRADATRMELDRALAHYQCLEQALKELNDLSVQEPNSPVAEEEAVAV
jgi:hypothetical protein